MDDLIGIALRASIMYAYALVVVRLTGKRSVGMISAADLMATFIIGDMFDDICWAEVPLAKGLVGVTTVALVHLLVEYGTYRWRTLDRIVDSSQTVLVRAGLVLRDGLRHERLGEEDVRSQIRQHGVDDLAEVREASLEPSGHVSVLKEDWAKPAEKRDLPRLERLLAAKGARRD